MKRILIALCFTFFLAMQGHSVFIPLKWDNQKNTDYYIIEQSTDSDFKNIVKIYTSNGNNVTISAKPGTYYFRVSPIGEKNRNPSRITKITVHSDNTVTFDDKKSSYPEEMDDIDNSNPIIIAFSNSDSTNKTSNNKNIGKTQVRLRGIMTFRAKWDPINLIWVRAD